jgi:hypothetical protein
MSATATGKRPADTDDEGGRRAAARGGREACDGEVRRLVADACAAIVSRGDGEAAAAVAALVRALLTGNTVGHRARPVLVTAARHAGDAFIMEHIGALITCSEMRSDTVVRDVLAGRATTVALEWCLRAHPGFLYVDLTWLACMYRRGHLAVVHAGEAVYDNDGACRWRPITRRKGHLYRDVTAVSEFLEAYDASTGRRTFGRDIVDCVLPGSGMPVEALMTLRIMHSMEPAPCSPRSTRGTPRTRWWRLRCVRRLPAGHTRMPLRCSCTARRPRTTAIH